MRDFICHIQSSQILLSYRSAVLMVFPVLSWHFDTGSDDDSVVVAASSNCTVLSQHKLNSSGFVVQAFLQSAAVFLLFLALDHERQFRSSGKLQLDTWMNITCMQSTMDFL